MEVQVLIPMLVCTLYVQAISSEHTHNVTLQIVKRSILEAFYIFSCTERQEYCKVHKLEEKEVHY